VKVYVASSWRNKKQQSVVKQLSAVGHEVYDFRHPHSVGAQRANRGVGFRWSDIDPNWQQWDPKRFLEALDDPIAKDGFYSDMDALHWCEACVLVMPCGRSAHLELGYAVGAGKLTAILLEDGEPELMYKMADIVSVTLTEIVVSLGASDREEIRS
jgi:hypothetical protein